MAELVLAAVTPHNPLLWRAMTDPVPDDLRPIAANFARIREAVASHEVDVLVVIGTDHLRQFFYDNSPAFAIGKADAYHGTWENEVRTFGMEYAEVVGHRELADRIAGRSVQPDAIDFSVSLEWRLDHAFVIPLQYVRPELDIPVVPIHANASMPPVPSVRRFVALGEHLRRSIDDWDADARVGILTSGHMANDVGGPRTFAGSPDPEFDALAAGWMRDGDLDGAIRVCSDVDRLTAAGSMTSQFLNAVAALAAMGGRAADFVDVPESRFSTSPFFLWSTR
ncbi:hypothetical protein GCM10017608_06410 [Agromyces luteolus]|uniref:Extradiol ring-cleavage dioxygenase class III enzyme subunit B domain-containing protein n=1 Tax=Agromyces luteolus TaxID=88373 RepID=A0A7C9HX37_9MICO|nr:hypothetical protein [Agromyces luteolus]MUN06260.1 hypothetical protein [Agromyces luteolus]GLK26709.1 hypothetical protein GCM10017608_06410 [Agromyces luteolus]